MLPDPPIFAPQILAQMVSLLNTEDAERLLQILRARIVTLSEMDDAIIAGPEGIAHVHRLASEAGMLGFQRLSTICSILDDVPEHRSATQTAWARAELQSTLQRSHEELIRQLGGALTGGDHGPAN